jgi:hypothetical protein
MPIENDIPRAPMNRSKLRRRDAEKNQAVYDNPHIVVFYNESLKGANLHR